MSAGIRIVCNDNSITVNTEYESNELFVRRRRPGEQRVLLDPRQLRELEEEYEGVRVGRGYGTIVFTDCDAGIEASSDIAFAIRSAGGKVKTRNLDGNGNYHPEVVLLDENTVVVMEDDEDGDPNTGYFHFITAYS